MHYSGSATAFILAAISTLLTAPLWGRLWGSIGAMLGPAVLRRELTSLEEAKLRKASTYSMGFVGLVLLVIGLTRA